MKINKYDNEEVRSECLSFWINFFKEWDNDALVGVRNLITELNVIGQYVIERILIYYDCDCSILTSQVREECIYKYACVVIGRLGWEYINDDRYKKEQKLIHECLDMYGNAVLNILDDEIKHRGLTKRLKTYDVVPEPMTLEKRQRMEDELFFASTDLDRYWDSFWDSLY